jgi:hypothetical protein
LVLEALQAVGLQASRWKQWVLKTSEAVRLAALGGPCLPWKQRPVLLSQSFGSSGLSRNRNASGPHMSVLLTFTAIDSLKISESSWLPILAHCSLHLLTWIKIYPSLHLWLSHVFVSISARLGFQTPCKQHLQQQQPLTILQVIITRITTHYSTPPASQSHSNMATISKRTADVAELGGAQSQAKHQK